MEPTGASAVVATWSPLRHALFRSRRLLIAAQTYLMVVTGVLAVLTFAELMTAWLLLCFIFALGLGTALMMPALSAIVPDLVPAA